MKILMTVSKSKIYPIDRMAQTELRVVQSMVLRVLLFCAYEELLCLSRFVYIICIF